MAKNDLIQDFQKTVSQRFPAKSTFLNASQSEQLAALRSENSNASKGKQRHLEGQFLPGIAIYETLQTVMPKAEVLQT